MLDFGKRARHYAVYGRFSHCGALNLGHHHLPMQAVRMSFFPSLVFGPEADQKALRHLPIKVAWQDFSPIDSSQYRFVPRPVPA